MVLRSTWVVLGERACTGSFRIPRMTKENSVEAAKQRFHGLDALRAWAMSLGIVLHAAWIMTPGEAGAPATDASASAFCGYIADSIHMFRMQLFFLLAGFFACLLLRKRGVKRFAVNRVLRILVPFLVFWAFLRPLMMWQWNVAKIRSGDDQSGRTGLQAMLEMYETFSAETFLTMHLWFIWYLLLIYVLVIAARGLILLVDRNDWLRSGVSRRFGGLVTSAWAPFALTLAAAPFMFPMEGIGGIEMDPWSLYPKWTGLLSYLVYFLVGWLIYRNVDRLSAMLSRWQWQLVAGGLMTIPFYFGAHYAAREGYVTPLYPMLAVSDVQYDYKASERAYSRMRQQLLDSAENPIAAAVMDRMPEGYQRFLQKHPSATENQLNGVLTALNKHVIADPAFVDDIDVSSLSLSDAVATIAIEPAAQRSPKHVQQVNREILEAGLPGSFYSEDVHRPYYNTLRAGYCVYYTLTTWLLIFGCLGFSQHFFTKHSPFWRYFSDSSYWMYLMHLLVQFQILLWVGEQPWHWTLKFGFYVGGTILVLVPTYHLLVRPTWLGWMLSGRMYSIRGEVPSKSKESVVEQPSSEAWMPQPLEPHTAAPAPAIAAQRSESVETSLAMEE
jgi:hypothetical protein